MFLSPHLHEELSQNLEVRDLHLLGKEYLVWQIMKTIRKYNTERVI